MLTPRTKGPDALGWDGMELVEFGSCECEIRVALPTSRKTGSGGTCRVFIISLFHYFGGDGFVRQICRCAAKAFDMLGVRMERGAFERCLVGGGRR